MRIDAHQHYWITERGDYGWLTPDKGILFADYLPEQLDEQLQRYGFERTIVVQAAPTMEETEFMLSLYEKYDSIAGVVGWLDLDSPDFANHYTRFRKHKGFVGFRPMIQDLPDPWILRKTVMDNLQLVVKDEFPIDLQLRPRHLPYMLEALQAYPTLTAVVDHAAKPFIAEGILEPWKPHMTELAAYPNVMCKLSGLVTEADQAGWKHEDLAPYVEHVVQVFGTQRIMFGSDWPVCLTTCSYGEVYEALQKALPRELSAEEDEAIYGGNASRFYKL
ncbi:amidohydrolase family protein [Paenibacillus radicis (ex Xue et al. 2023)]|uniref:Amidohydrolase family protein n=1 Tax=Paenibacillus radicis (ex Xue et al. 2023) TaxID=2972489 RepID=A0ABT1YV93_9BACL|nr:amidohydrolase family protein [Paenibacillus radicis (ex Xue et al. 2023)]MCR8636848.1 amidohydrolase family protein [Paenibacillus radicis (ex Xue et al. 2023)]